MSDTSGIDKVTALVVDLAKAIKTAAENGANFALDLPLVLPIITDAPAALSSLSVLVGEVKTLDPAGLAQVEADALAILAAADGVAVSTKTTTYVQSAIQILTAIWTAINAK